MLVKVSDGRVPNKEDLQAFNEEMDILVSEYETLKAEAESVLNADEMPKDGSRAKEYVEAIANSKSRIIKLQLEEAESILQRFLKVKSLIAEYETALSPFKEKAVGVLKDLSEDNIEKMLPETEAPKLFLKALDIENINGPDGFKILGEINKYYPMQVQWGLVGKQYFVDENNNEEIQTEEPAEQSEENTDEVATTVETEEMQEPEITSGNIEIEEFAAEEQQVETTQEIIDEVPDAYETKENTVL